MAGAYLQSRAAFARTALNALVALSVSISGVIIMPGQGAGATAKATSKAAHQPQRSGSTTAIRHRHRFSTAEAARIAALPVAEEEAETKSDKESKSQKDKSAEASTSAPKESVTKSGKAVNDEKVEKTVVKAQPVEKTGKSAATEKTKTEESKSETVATEVARSPQKLDKKAQKLEKKKAKEAKKTGTADNHAAITDNKAGSQKESNGNATAPEKAAEKKAVNQATEMQAEKSPAFLPDSALISLLKDLQRVLRDPDTLAKVEGANQKAVIQIAEEALSKAVENPDLQSNRIVQKRSNMTTEAWSSGNIKLSETCQASLAVVWGKHENGLINVTIAGSCPQKTTADGKKIGQFIVILSGRSSIEKGFDIQSQSEVSYWLAKLDNTTVDADCCAPMQTASEQKTTATAEPEEKELKKNSLIVLQEVLTDRRRAYLAEVDEFERHQRLLAQKVESERKFKESLEKASGEESAQTNQVSSRPAGDKASNVKLVDKAKDKPAGAISAERKAATSKQEMVESTKLVKPAMEHTESTMIAKSRGDHTESTVIAKSAVDHTESTLVVKPVVDSKPGAETEKGAPTTLAAATTVSVEKSTRITDADIRSTMGGDTSKTTLPIGTEGSASREVNTGSADSHTLSVAQAPGTPRGWDQAPTVNVQSATQTVAMMVPPETNPRVSPGWESAGVPLAGKQPGRNAIVVLPDRAVAGQYLTASVVSDSNPETGVEIGFNGNTLPTDSRGEAQFRVPDDATPGRSLNVALSSRPDLNPGAIDVLQPLVTPSQHDVPRIDKVTSTVSTKSIMTIDGHSFDGIADSNRVLIDGQYEARVLASSPVQIKVQVPALDIHSGMHAVAVSASAMKSNPALFQLASVEVQTDGKEKEIGKLYVKVLGTKEPCQIHIVNQTPEMIRISKGNDLHLTTAGGENNTAVLMIQRLRKGNFKVNAEIERI